MNFIITMNCNKGCKYCFASKSRSEEKNNREMSFDNYKSMLDKITDEEPIKLLGGEPTNHKDFELFFDEAVSRRNDITLISNFLFNEEKLNVILKSVGKKKITFLINSTDLEILDRMKTFSKNYNSIYKELYKIDDEESMSIGITFDENKDWKYYIDYLNYLKENLLGIERLRVSIPNPDRKKEDFFIINNKGLGKKFFSAIKWSLDNGIKVTLDCIIYPCLFDNKEEWKFISRFLTNIKTKCTASPSDYFPDETVSFCYPTKESIKIDSNKYDSSKQIYDDMILRKNILMSKIKLPKECRECPFKEKNMCNGPCAAFYDLSNETVGINI